MNAFAQPAKDILRRLIPRIAVLWMFLPLTFIVPWLNSTAPPYFDLTGWIGAVGYRLAVSGGSRQGPWIVIGFLLIMVSRPGLSVKRRLIEFVTMGVTLLVLLSGGSVLNEYAIKTSFGVPRPHVIALANTPAGVVPGDSVSTEETMMPEGALSPETSLLKITADSLYAMAPAERRAYMIDLLGFDAVAATPGRLCLEELDANPELHVRKEVCGHWASTTQGFSFPSGHAYSAMFLATFFWGLALSVLSGWRLAFFQYLVMPWTVLMAYSRVILRVHSPLDITVGGLLGVIMGLAAFLLVRMALRREG